METLQPPPPVEHLPTDLAIPEYLSIPVSFSEAVAAPIETVLPNPVEEALPPAAATLRQRIGNKVLQITKAESVGTAFDVATMAVGVPLPVREASGSVIDYKMYGESADGTAEAAKSPSRIQKLRKAAGTVALYAVTGIAAQKYGMEFAESMHDGVSQGVAGEYVIPLATKLGAVTGVNAVMNKFSR